MTSSHSERDIACTFCGAQPGQACQHTATGEEVYRHDTRWIAWKRAMRKVGRGL